jgi:EmrB/QacA subfamily drug resistance transporter
VALAVLCTLLFLTFLDNTIVSVALGSVQTTLHASVADLQWVVGAYALTFASAMLACGMIGDEFGRKVVMLSGAGVFCAGSVLCALAPDPGVLIAGRAVMGLGAAASEPGTLSMLRQLYPDQPGRDRAIGVWAAVSGLALALGPVIGGVLVGAWNWRALFWFNLVFGLAALILAALVLPESVDQNSADPDAHRVDTAGALLGAAALATLMFAIIDAETAGFAAARVIVLFGVSAAAAVAFVWRESRAAHPLIDLKIFRLARFSTANAGAFCTYFATFAVFFFTALYLFEVVGLSGYRIALVFLPLTVLMIAASLVTGGWLAVIGLRWAIAGGCLLFAAGLVLTDLNLSPHPDYGWLVPALALAGAGIGATVVPITSSALSVVPPERSGLAASATNTSREIGAVTGVSVLGALVYGQLNRSIAGQLRGLGLPASIQKVVITGVETGQVPASNSSGIGPAGQAALVQKVIEAAYTAFHDGLRDALFASAALVFVAGLLAVVTLRAGSAEAEPTDNRGDG